MKTQIPKMEPHNYARRCLNSLATSKEWAAEIGVSARLIRAWTAGEKPIPTKHLSAISEAGKRFCERLNALQQFFDQALSKTYGPSDPGRF